MTRDVDGGVDPEFDWGWAQEEGDWVPPAVDPTRPSVARMYDHYLGGKDSLEADREAAESVVRSAPSSKLVALANRQFLVNAVQLMCEAGVRQFIDLGTGIPNSPNVHEVARAHDPTSRVVYVDNDPVVLVHNRALLARHDGVATIMQDIRQPAAVLGDPVVKKMLDFSQPVGLLGFAVLHFVAADLAPEILTQYRRALVPGSYLALSVACSDGVPATVVRDLETIYRSASAPLFFRTVAQIEQLFDGFELVAPGLVPLTRWRVDGDGGLGAICGVGRRV